MLANDGSSALADEDMLDGQVDEDDEAMEVGYESDEDDGGVDEGEGDDCGDDDQGDTEGSEEDEGDGDSFMCVAY